jgi:hypothetical protein
VSRLLKDQKLDIIQVHLAPLILGSGLAGFLLPSAHKICQARRFESFFYTLVDDEIMFTGVPRKGKNEA